jgi:hypothetical protein
MHKLISSTTIFKNMEGKLHLYSNMAIMMNYKSLENVVQTPQDGPFDHEN